MGNDGEMRVPQDVREGHGGNKARRGGEREEEIQQIRRRKIKQSDGVKEGTGGGKKLRQEQWEI